VNDDIRPVIGRVLGTNWSICSRAGAATSLTETDCAPAASFGHPEGAGAGAGAPILAVGTLVAELDPFESVAVTATRTVLPWSALLSWYVCAVAPEMSWQAPPFSSQMRHWYLNVLVPEPFHCPGSAESVLPAAALPLIVGGAVFAGPEAAAILALGVLVAPLEPSELLAIKCTRSVLPGSALLIVYVSPVCPAMSWQAPPLAPQMRH
jgi:hypothetical protein